LEIKYKKGKSESGCVHMRFGRGVYGDINKMSQLDQMFNNNKQAATGGRHYFVGGPSNGQRAILCVVESELLM